MFDWSGFAERVTAGTANPLDAVPALAGLNDEQLLGLEQEPALAVIETTQAVLAALGAAQALAMEAFARREEEHLHEFRAHERAHHRSTLGIKYADDVAPDMLAPVFHVAPRTMHALLHDTRVLVNHLPVTLAMARAGRLEMTRARAVASEAGAIDPGYRHDFETQLHAKNIADLAHARLRQHAARTALRVDPASAAHRAQSARQERDVTIRPGAEPGMSDWYARQPAETSARAWAAIDALAAEYARANPALTIAQARADAMMNLLLGHATITTTIDLLVPAPADPPTGADGAARPDQAMGSDQASGGDPDQPRPGRAGRAGRAGQPDPGATLARITFRDLTHRLLNPDCLHGAIHNPAGIILNEHLSALLADPDTRIRLHSTDPDTGYLTGHDPTTYRPGAHLARTVRSRDGTCRFPGCATPATRCQLDHVTPFPHGPTSADNLASLCASHHGFKHHAGWSLAITPDGTCTWTSPQHRSYTTYPQDHRDLAA